nr:EOG090X0FYC [Sida crystallina]
MTDYPLRIFCFSGKRKTGKDYVTDILYRRLTPRCVIVRLSAPIKRHWAESKQLNYDQLLSDGEYKENHRLEMIRWGEEERKKDPAFFCRSAIEISNAKEHPFWIVSDMRRATDLQFFQENFSDRVMTVRISASDNIRKERGFTFTKGIDDEESECGLDHIDSWNVVIQNEGDNSSLENDIQLLLNFAK